MRSPNASDIARATEFVDGFMRQFLRCDEAWFAREREKAIRQIADAEMQKRQQSERSEGICAGDLEEAA